MPTIKKEQSWFHKSWDKSLERLTAHAKSQMKISVEALEAALGQCRNPMTDHQLAPWRPSEWRAQDEQKKLGEWIEYYLGDNENRGRAIACYDRNNDTLTLVTKTCIHDHGHLRKQVAGFR